MGSTLTTAQWNALVQQHKGVVGKKTASKHDALGNEIAGTSTTTYTFGDGTQISGEETPQTDAWSEGGFNVTDPGTAIKPAKTETPANISAPPTQQWIVWREPDGTIVQRPNPNYRAPEGKTPSPQNVPTSANEPYIVTRMPDGTTKTEPNPNYKQPTPTAPVTRTDPNGNVVQYDPDKKTWAPAPGIAPKDAAAAGVKPMTEYERAEYERQTKQDALANDRNAATTALAQAKFEWDKYMDQQNLALKNGTISQTQYENNLKEKHAQIADQVALAAVEDRRAKMEQDQRDTEMNVAKGVTDASLMTVPSWLEHMAPVGTSAALGQMGSDALNGKFGGGGLPTGPMPFDPRTIGAETLQNAYAAVAHLSPMAAQAVGAPHPNTVPVQAPPPGGIPGVTAGGPNFLPEFSASQTNMGNQPPPAAAASPAAIPPSGPAPSGAGAAVPPPPPPGNGPLMTGAGIVAGAGAGGGPVNGGIVGVQAPQAGMPWPYAVE